MLFCDVQGSTAAAEQMDPEEWAEIMNGAFQHLIAPVYKYEGTLARLMGDAILAFFGAELSQGKLSMPLIIIGIFIVLLILIGLFKHAIRKILIRDLSLLEKEGKNAERAIEKEFAKI